MKLPSPAKRLKSNPAESLLANRKIHLIVRQVPRCSFTDAVFSVYRMCRVATYIQLPIFIDHCNSHRRKGYSLAIFC